MQANQSEQNQEPVSKKGCLIMLVIGILFILGTTYLLFYMGSISKGQATEESFKQAIIECKEKSAKTNFKLDKDNCEKSTRKFIRKFGYQP